MTLKLLTRSIILAALLIAPPCLLTAAEAPAKTPPAASDSKSSTPEVIDPKAEAIFDRWLALIDEHGTLEFTSEAKVSYTDSINFQVPADISDPIRFVVDFRSADKTMPYHRLSAERMRDGKVVERFAHDGTRLAITDHAGKSYRQSPEGMEPMVSKGAPSRMLGDRAIALAWIQAIRAAKAAGKNPRTVVSCTIVGEETVDGVACDIVRRASLSKSERQGGQEYRATESIAFAKTDGIPRRIEITSEMGVGGSKQGQVQYSAKLTAVRAGVPVDDQTFSTTLPHGYVDKSEEIQGGKAPQYKVNVGDKAPDFALRDLDGKEVTLASLKGKVVLLDFWATWCGPCIAAMPVIEKISGDYRGKDVVVFGVNVFEKQDDAAAHFLKKRNHTYGCLLKGDSLAEAFGISAIPTIVVIGRDGKVALIGGVGSPLRPVIDKALEAK